MKLLTAEIIKQLEKNPTYSGDDKKVVPVLVKFFTPWSNWTWYAVEAEKTEDGNWMFYGLTEGHEKELGYFSFAELQMVRGPFGLRIERDMHFSGYMLDKETKEVRRAA